MICKNTGPNFLCLSLYQIYHPFTNPKVLSNYTLFSVAQPPALPSRYRELLGPEELTPATLLSQPYGLFHIHVVPHPARPSPPPMAQHSPHTTSTSLNQSINPDPVMFISCLHKCCSPCQTINSKKVKSMSN